MSRVSRKLDAAKRVGRVHSKYAFEVSNISASFVPAKLAGSELVVQLSRGPKIAQCKVDTSTRGQVNWGAQRLSFVATLYQSKTGKAFSDKTFKASICAARPATFGTTKRTLREIGCAEINISEFARQSEPQWHSIALQRRVKISDEPPIELTMQIKATCLKGPTAGKADDDDDDDDGRSISSVLTGFSRVSMSEEPSEVAMQAAHPLDLTPTLAPTPTPS